MKTSKTITSQTTRYNYKWLICVPSSLRKGIYFLCSVIYLKTTSPVIICPVIADDDIMMKTVWWFQNEQSSYHCLPKLCSIIQFKNLALSMSRSTGQMKWEEVMRCLTSLPQSFHKIHSFFTSRTRKADLPKQHMRNTWQKTMQVGFSEKRKKVQSSSHVSLCLHYKDFANKQREPQNRDTKNSWNTKALLSDLPPGPTINPPIQTFSAFAQSLSLYYLSHPYGFSQTVWVYLCVLNF